MGVRAEDVELCGPEEADASGIVAFVERLGERTLLYVRLSSGKMIIAETDGKSRIKAQDAVDLKLNKAGIHLFDADGKAYHGDEV